MLDEERVDGDPEARVDPLAQRGFGLLGRPGPDDAEPVRDAMHVGVDRDRRDPVPENEDAVRGLGADTGEGGEFLEGPGNRATEPVEQLPGHRSEGPRLHAIEAGRPDEHLDFGRPRPGERRGVRESGEEASARHVGVRIARTLREDRTDEDLERVLGVVPQVRPSPVPCPVERAEPVEEAFPIERDEGAFARHSVSFRGPAGSVATAAGDGAPGSERSGSSRSPDPRTSSPIK